MTRKQGRQTQGEALVGEQARGKVDGNIECAAALVDLRGRCDRLREDKIGELADAVMLLSGGNELACRDRALLGVSPASERFGADDPPRREIEFGLIGHPNFAAVDGVV